MREAVEDLRGRGRQVGLARGRGEAETPRVVPVLAHHTRCGVRRGFVVEKVAKIAED